MRRLKLSSSTITTVLLRDGTLYFIALLGVNILQLLTYSDRFSNGSYADGFLQSMPSLLMQRFMLNLRQPDHSTGESELDEGHSSSLSLSFRRSSGFLGNIGEPLDHSQSEYLQDDGDHDVYCATEDSQNRLGESFVQHAGPQCAPHADLIHISQGEPASLVSAAVTPTPAPAESLVFVNQVMQG
ncbi:uncharacterized protein PHACADRAFT_253332 [Phanerochaete carnosa HHB-10118-sp]|uniref:Uncharacterized protein n=1 Tax=Phanerochaete carnosa (strain HHB-10118-sp) TaxID=650164 RepID=K5V1D0_PHACS|nr:uncharacterized protein PHACADRAFT_253332 [Phanerochaete carnosa HHB-10118-sp]EKM56286.1 hypothetical protein PHACADRAFT_253332 [Phanerochaete carnosa HHB-10118-sp]